MTKAASAAFVFFGGGVNRRLLFASTLLVIFSGLVFWPGLHGGFLFDDLPNLVEDPDWKVESADPGQWMRAARAGIASGSGRPLAMLSFSANYYFTGLDPFALKLTGLLMHVLNGVLVLLLCRRLFARMPARESAERLGHYAALLVALAWTVHPLQVSTALYIVQRMEIGAYTGVLLALLSYVIARQRQIEGGRSWHWWLIALMSWLFGLGFKESALLLPGYALLIEWFGFGFRSATPRSTTILKAVYLVGAGAAVLGFLVFVLPWSLRPETYSFRDFTLAERLLTQFPVLVHYLGQILLPYPSRLTFYYDNFPVSTGLLSPPGTLTSMLVLVSVLVGSLLMRRRWRLLSFGVLWFFCAHALTSNVVPLELAFEHRNYFALLGILIAVAQLLAWGGSRLSVEVQRLLGAGLVLCLAFFGGLQAHAWGEPFRLAFALETRNPESPRAGYQFGIATLGLAGEDLQSPFVDLAVKQFEHVAEVGASPLADQGLIILLSRTGQEVPPAVWDRLRKKLHDHEAGVEHVSALRGILECRIIGKCAFDDQQLLGVMLAAVERNPESALVLVQYANFAWNVAGERGLAIEVMREAVRLEPKQPQYLVNLIQFLRLSGGDPAEIESLERQVAAWDSHGSFTDQLR